jgi:hypothetical protein
VEGDTLLADFDEAQWQEVNRQNFQHSDSNPYDYSICILERISGPDASPYEPRRCCNQGITTA